MFAGLGQARIVCVFSLITAFALACEAPTIIQKLEQSPADPAEFPRLAAGGGTTCALSGQDLICWGRNDYGQLGHGHTKNIGDDELPNAAGPVAIGGPARAIALGRDHACALRADARVVCWGKSLDGVLGYGDLDIIGNNELADERKYVDIGATIRSIHAGPLGTCAITLDGALACWGDNRVGQLGYGILDDIGDDEPPSRVGFVDVGGPVIDVAMTWGNTCALLESGELRCWGYDGPALGAGAAQGQTIGDDEPPSSITPVDLGGPAKSIDAGFYHVCALLEAGELVCWGSSDQGQLGYGDFETIGDDETPASVGAVELGEPALALALGLQHSCALGQSGAVYCWGRADHGRLGYPEMTDYIGGERIPAEVGPVALPGPVDEIAAGDAHTCARIGENVICWGSGYAGQLGYGSTENLGDDEPAASGGFVEFVGGEGHGVELDEDEPDDDELDGLVDATLRVGWAVPELPAALAVGESLELRGSYWSAFGCEDCSDSFVVRSAADQQLVLASLDEERDLHPHPGILAMLGTSPETWLAPLELEIADVRLCPELESDDEDCFGERLALELVHPDAPTARLLDETRGLVGGGFWVSVLDLEDWSEACSSVDEISRRNVDLIASDCGPNCGPIEFVEACVPPLDDLGHTTIQFAGSSRPIDPGYAIRCEILEQELSHDQWRLELDCVGS